MVRNIQVLRCFAALAVVLHHLQLRLHDELGGPVISFVGRAGVDVFFVISGFIMFHTTRNNERTTFQFWTDRVIRIAPIYWLATLTVAVLFWLNLQPIDVKALGLKDILADLAFLPSYRADGDPYPILDVGWTLNYEMYFYLLFGLTFFLRSQVVALAGLAAWFVATGFIGAYTPHLPHMLSFFFEPITLEFAAGGALALLYRRDYRFGPAAMKYLGAALLALGLIVMLADGAVWGEFVNSNPVLRISAFGIPAVMIVAGALLLERGGVSARSRILLLLGAASYSIYLIHQLALQFFLRAVEAVWTTPDAFGLAVIAIVTFVVAALAGVAMHLWVEKPLTSWLHALVRRKRKTRPAPITTPATESGPA